jgi:6-phosphogluconolactonase (cycloisomerase 2 family)
MKRLSFIRKYSAVALGLGIIGTTAKAESAGAVYTMDNAAGRNQVLVFDREENGRLLTRGGVPTGGSGSGAGLSSQGSVVLSLDNRWLFVCNTGSSEISVMAVTKHGLQLADKVPSGGLMPVSLALRHNLLYVLNAGGGAGDKDNIVAFVFADGKLLPLPNSARLLSGDNTGPAQVSFTSDGDRLIVTERLTNLIDTYAVDGDGVAGTRTTSPSAGMTPFGFDVGRHDRLFVSEAATGSASSYTVSATGELQVISGAVPTQQSAPCWLLTSHNERFVYTANAGSGSISGFHVGHDGSLELLNADGRTAVTGDGSHPVDMAQSHDGRFLYNLANGDGTLHGFKVKENGSLEPVMVLNGIPTSAAGLAGH